MSTHSSNSKNNSYTSSNSKSTKTINNLINSIENTRQNAVNNNKSGFQHYSGIYKNGKECFTGCNTLRNVYNNSCIFYSTHAEMSVIYKILKSCKLQPFKDFVDLSDYSIVVIRCGKDGSLKNSRPCNNCLEIMVKYRIKKISYSTDTGDVMSEKPENMEQMHVSSGWNAFKKFTKKDVIKV